MGLTFYNAMRARQKTEEKALKDYQEQQALKNIPAVPPIPKVEEKPPEIIPPEPDQIEEDELSEQDFGMRKDEPDFEIPEELKNDLAKPQRGRPRKLVE